MREGSRKGAAYSKSVLEVLEGIAGAVAVEPVVRGGQRRGLRREGIAPKRKAECGLGSNRRYRAGSACHFWEACWH